MSQVGTPAAGAVTGAAPAIASAAAPAAAAGGGGGLLGLLNSPVGAMAVQGLGNGISAASAAKAQTSSERAERERIESNYAVRGGLLGRGAAGPSAPPAAGLLGYGTSFVYDPAQGRIVQRAA
jgi:hypothetical protein